MVTDRNIARLAVGCAVLLYQVNQARAALTATAATATSPTQLHGFQSRLDAANGAAEEAVQVIRDQLDLPPPETS
jgi:Flp pilus assembly protein TadD